MKLRTRIAAVIAAMSVVGLGSVSTAAAGGHEHEHGDHGGHAVFVQTNNPAGNQIVAYSRAEDGTLTPGDTYDTGGLGAIQGGAVADTLASQGSLVFDEEHNALLAVNAGSDSLTVFRVKGDELKKRQVASSQGSFPESITIHDNLVYVLNARNGGSVAGYTFEGGRLRPIDNSVRRLGLDPNVSPEFLNTAAQVAFTPDGQHLVVTTKGNGHDILVYDVGRRGRLSDHPVVNAQPAGSAPFAIAFAGQRLVVTLAGTSSLAKYEVNSDSTLTTLANVPDGQKAACWVSSANGRFYVSNAGSSNISIYENDGSGGLTLVGAPVATDPGTVDSAATLDGKFLYVQSGTTGIIDGFHIEADGGLTPIATTLVPNAVGFEGIAAS
ncbi:MAG: hypothetical protein QOE09_1223 [Ilumatobacteraceae bacterium]